MSRRCLICKKGPKAGKNVAHSKKTTVRRFLPNIQKKKFKLKNKIYDGYICTRCMRTYKEEIVYL
ncbi:MAG: 50S ribosomal protein L28 [Elusimicrobiota bacterium]|nr:50S ribosomal protein L28 [Endomicrobiia bacterium]MDW8165599.1 50S ribosomal protein L28 [Elusimicrobiota bacterium]